MTNFSRMSLIFFIACIAAMPAHAYRLNVRTPGADKDLRSTILGASLLQQQGGEARDAQRDAQDVLAAARADYNRIVSVLFAQGYYSGIVSIRLDGHEAASIPPLDAPSSVNTVVISVIPGPISHFSKVAIGPIAPGTELPEGYAPGKVAHAPVIIAAADAGVSAWREAGHAKARVSYQKIVADHRTNELSSDIGLAPGPIVHFGQLDMSGNQRLRTRRLREIAGFPTGEVYDPKKLDAMQSRLQRTGIFSSVSVTEAKTLGPGDSLDVNLAVVEQKKRRMGFGVEYSTIDGVNLNAYWLHRNLSGSGERLRIDGDVTGVGGSTGGTDYSLGLRLDRPATFAPEISAYMDTGIVHKDEEDYHEDAFHFGFGVKRTFAPFFTGQTGIRYDWSKVADSGGQTYFRYISLPTSLIRDKRNNALDTTRGHYIGMSLTPFAGLSNDTGTGVQLTGDLRGYKGFGAHDRFVLAGRLLLGKVFGSDLAGTPRDYLFYSGGGGTVRGQPYQSLGVNVLDGGALRTGGTEFVGMSGELRLGVTKSIGVVAFCDYGHIAGGGDSGSQAGAGLGLRYKTGIGPIRLDVATPVSGGTDSDVQVYLGIGQAF